MIGQLYYRSTHSLNTTPKLSCHQCIHRCSTNLSVYRSIQASFSYTGLLILIYTTVARRRKYHRSCARCNAQWSVIWGRWATGRPPVSPDRANLKWHYRRFSTCRWIEIQPKRRVLVYRNDVISNGRQSPSCDRATRAYLDRSSTSGRAPRRVWFRQINIHD